MKQSKLIIGGFVVLAVVIVIGLLALGHKSVKNTTMSSNMAMSDSDKSGGSSTSSASAGDAVATNMITISNYMFGPAKATVKVGDTVTWTNKDDVHHNIVADNPASDAPNGPLIGNGESYSFKFTKAGTYTYHCDPHPYMHGTVVVTN